MRKRSLILPVVLAALALPHAGSAQATRLITGTVTDAANARPLQGATITVEGSNQGALTNEEGTFRLLVPTRAVTITARYIGYTRQTKAVPANENTVEFALDRDVLELESVVVTGQATTVSRRSATTASSLVGGEELNRVAAPTFEDALNGKVSGVNIQSNSGAPGGGIQLQIRGNNTILGSHDPLYVVDGVIYSNAKIPSGRGSITAAAFATAEDDAVNRVADINPADIESIEILKGAAASSIYGSKAANGVVIITTRRGQIGAPRVTLRQRLGQYRPVNEYESRRWTQQEAVDKYGDDVAHWFADNPNPYFNHYEQVFTPADLSYETALDVSGGTEGTRYFVGGVWKRDDGIERNTGFSRQGLRLNLDQQVGSRATLKVSTVYNRSEHDRGWNNNCNNYACHGYAFAYTPSFVDLSRKDDQGLYLDPDWGVQANSMQLTDFAENNEETNRFTGGVTLDYDAYASERHQVRLVGGAGIDVFHQNNSLWTPRELFFERAQNQPGTAIEGDGRSTLYNWNLSGVHTFSPGGGWSLTTSAGLQYEDQSLEVGRITTIDLVPGQRNVDQGTTTTVADDLNQERTIAVYAQEELRLLNELLLLQGGLRAERSSVNGDIDAFNIFPKISASYRILGVLGEGSEIKPRLAYGETGNLPVFGQKFTLLGTPRLGGLSGFTVAGAAGNKDVEPERVKEIEVGIDGIAWNERLTWELTGFVRNTTNLLLTRVPPPSSGFVSQVFNGGKLENRGIEAGLGVSVIERENVLWVSRATFTAYRNEVKDLAGLPPFRPPLSGFGGLGVTFVEVGEPMTQIVGRDFDGQGGRTPTDVQLGNSAPDFRMGFVNTVTYKRFDFSAVLDYQQGGDIINLTQFLYDDAETAADFGSEAHAFRLEGYNNGVMTPYIEDASFVKLREISVGVWLPERWIQRYNVGLQTARISISGRNLYTWSDYSGLDPEVANLGSAAIRNNLDVAPYPPSRSFFFEFTLGF